jgi:hypothetical protein
MSAPAAAGTPPVALQGVAGEAAVPSAAYSTPNNRMVWEISRQGSLSNLQQRTEPLPELQPGQALVAVRALGERPSLAACSRCLCQTTCYWVPWIA